MEYMDCGCIVQTMCPLHAQAEGMFRLIRQIGEGRQHTPPGQERKTLDELEQDARALLRAIEGRVTP